MLCYLDKWARADQFAHTVARNVEAAATAAGITREDVPDDIIDAVYSKDTHLTVRQLARAANRLDTHPAEWLPRCFDATGRCARGGACAPLPEPSAGPGPRRERP